ncbi:MAG: aminodeoxychorismate/anthranilate synthase component II [Desulfobacterales bacterium]|nr:aminodeoxychorismate/anthranilate synthase component II [Desulfobacterales bacterium]
MATMLVIDNYDSFTYNLVQMFMPFPLDIKVVRSDKLTLAQAHRLSPDYLLISPGPKDPAHAGISVPLIQSFYQIVPVLGVCLGMQCMNEVFGGVTTRAPLPMHGKTSDIYHRGRGLFAGIPSPFTVARYHSLMVEFEASELAVTARSDDGVVMGMSHPCYPLHGVQFHPESFLTQWGELLIQNFLSLGPLRKDCTALEAVCRLSVTSAPSVWNGSGYSKVSNNAGENGQA